MNIGKFGSGIKSVEVKKNGATENVFSKDNGVTENDKINFSATNAVYKVKIEDYIAIYNKYF